MRRRRVPSYNALTSLLDVLFILVFASLVNTAGIVQADAASDSQDIRDQRDDSVVEVPDAGPTPSEVQAIDYLRTQKEAALQVAAELQAKIPVYVFINVTEGILERLEVGRSRASIRVAAPLVAESADADIELAYLGETSPDSRLCMLVRDALAVENLSGHFVIVFADLATETTVRAIAQGLQQDVQHCVNDTQGVAVLLVEPHMFRSSERDNL